LSGLQEIVLYNSIFRRSEQYKTETNSYRNS